MCNRCKSALLCLIAAGACANGAVVRGDLYVLANEGQVRGELENRDQSPREKFVIRSSGGARVTIDRSQVKQIIPQSAAEIEYEKIGPTFADTVEDQWRLAEWCRENSLPSGRQAALERTVQLNPNHREARIALGYSQIEGRWVQPDELMRERGYVRYKGEWRLPQEVEVLQRRRKEDLAQKEWFTALRRLRGQLDDPVKGRQALESIQAIDDPYAVAALVTLLDSEPVRRVRVLYVDTLAHIEASAALKALVLHSLENADEEVRATCLDRLSENPHPDAVESYVAALRSKDNWRVSRAGHALGKLGDKSAIVPLIDALVTTHKLAYTAGSGGPGSMSAGFSPQAGMGLSMGSSTTIVKREVSNQRVLDALVTLTGGVNFGFDEKAWKNWYASQHKPSSVDTRRD